MKKQLRKMVLSTLILSMVSSVISTDIIAEEAIAVSMITPTDNEMSVSVVDDILISFSGEIDDSLLTKENFYVESAGTVPEYNIEKDGNNVKLNFDDEFDYNEEYIVTIKNVVSEQSFNFTTEENPLTLLFEEDFNSATTDDIKKLFMNNGWQDQSFSVSNQALLVKNPGSNDIGQGPVVSIIGSENWTDYEIYGEFKQRPLGNGVIAVRQNIDTSSQSRQDNTGYYIRSGNLGTETGMHLDITSYGASYKNPTYASATENPEIADETFYGVTVSAVGNKIDAKTTNLLTGETMNTVSYTDEANTYSKGAVGFTSLREFTYWDNIKIIDKGFNFEPDKIKNTDGTILLNFNGNIVSESVTEEVVTVKKGENTVLSMVEVIDDKTVQVTIPEYESDTKYEITVSKEVKRASDNIGMSSDKTFSILTSDEEPIRPILVSGVEPSDNAKDVSIFADPVVSFSNELDESSLEGKFAITSEYENVPDFKVEKDGNKAVIKLEQELNYAAEYTVVVGSGIKDINGDVLEAGMRFTFTTEENNLNVLFEEDFNSATTDDINKLFMNNGWQDQSFSVSGQALLVKNPGSNDIGQGPVVSIIGSENWTDYEIYGEFKQRPYGNGVIAVRQNIDTSSQSRQDNTGYYIRSGNLGTETGMHLDITSYGANYKNPTYASATENPEIADETFYGVTVSAVGNKIDAKTTNLLTGETMNTVSYTDEANTYSKGAVGFTSLREFTYWDNIKIIDKGFSFKPVRVKNVKGNFSLLFTEDVDEKTIEGNIIVTDKNGNALDVRTTLAGTKKVDVVVENAMNGEMYEVTVKKDVANVDGDNMAKDKTINITVAFPYEIEYVYPADKDGEISALVAGETVKGVARINHLNGEQSYTVVIAVYDETGAMYDAMFKTVNLTKKDAVTIETAEITLPENVTGYKASVFLMDSVSNIRPLTNKVSIPK